MNRWRSRLAQLQRGIGERPAIVQNVHNVQNPLRDPTYERIERFERPVSSVLAFVPPQAENQGAIPGEHDDGVASGWAGGLARLDPNQPPGDVPAQRWSQFIENCKAFLGEGWAERAAALGWGPLDLFGCDRARPFARIDHQGLLWLLGDKRIVEVHRDKAIVETTTGARQTYRRGPIDIDRVVLAWELEHTQGRPESR
jgi:hypothetical protein